MGVEHVISQSPRNVEQDVGVCVEYGLEGAN